MSFLHSNCKAGMCNDCVSIAEEYEHLLNLRTNALQTAEHKLEQALRDLEKEKRLHAMYEEVSKAGIGDIIAAWMDREIGKIIKQ